MQHGELGNLKEVDTFISTTIPCCSLLSGYRAGDSPRMAVTDQETERIEFPSAGGKITLWLYPVPFGAGESLCSCVAAEAATSSLLVWKQQLVWLLVETGDPCYEMSKIALTAYSRLTPRQGRYEVFSFECPTHFFAPLPRLP